MNTIIWKFLSNPFLRTTRGSNKKALLLGDDHLAKLIGNQLNPVIAALLAIFNPVWQSFKAADLNLRIALGDYKGETRTVEELFEQLYKEQLPDWEAAIHVHFRKGRPEEIALFPQGRKPFQNGTYVSRIQEIEALGTKCALIAVLQPLSIIILAFHIQIESARELQQSTGEAQVAALRTLRETARVTLCHSMFGNLGALINQYQTNPEQVANYFDISLLRSKKKATPKLIEVNGTVVNAQTDQPVVNASVKFVMDNGTVVTVQTDSNGMFEAELGTFSTTINVTMEVTAAGYISYSETGPAEPGEDIEVDVELVPMPTPPTP